MNHKKYVVWADIELQNKEDVGEPFGLMDVYQNMDEPTVIGRFPTLEQAQEFLAKLELP